VQDDPENRLPLLKWLDEDWSIEFVMEEHLDRHEVLQQGLLRSLLALF
jgi:hypothetical protein